MFAGGIFLAAFVIFSLVLACWQIKPSDAGRALTPSVAPRRVTSDEISLWKANPDVQTNRHCYSRCRQPFGL